MGIVVGLQVAQAIDLDLGLARSEFGRPVFSQARRLKLFSDCFHRKGLAYGLIR